MKFLKFPILFMLFLAQASFQSPKTPPNDPILLKVGEKEITISEFKFIYDKNNANNKDAYSEKSIRTYLDLFIKFKLKVNAALEQQYDQSTQFQKEYNIYKKQLAKPYLTENKVTDALVKQAYQRLKYEINASHILIQVPENALPEDTLKAFQKIQNIRNKTTQGEHFKKLAQTFSEDPSVKENAGNLGWFTALQMVYQFEDMAYNTPKNRVSPIFRTSYGYHILKVHQKRPSNGSVKVAHLMIRIPRNATPDEIQTAKTKILAIEREVARGKKWNKAVQQYSDDVMTKDRYGELDWFSAGTMIKSIEEAAFKLKKSGDISHPVRTPYGFHLIRLVARKHLDSFEKMEDVLRQKVSRDSRSELNRRLLIERLKRENQFVESEHILQRIDSLATPALMSASWKYDTGKPVIKSQIFKIKNKKYALEAFLEFVRGAQQVQRSGTPESYIRKLYKAFKKQQILEYEENHLTEKHPKYKLSLQEYKEGILLFQIMEKKVWTKALSDTDGLHHFFQQNQQNYQQKTTAVGKIFDLKNESTYQQLLRELEKELHPDRAARFKPTGFASNAVILRSSEQESVNQVIVYLKNNPDAIVELHGTFSMKEKAELARQRIKIVRKYMTDKGIESHRIAEKIINKATSVKATEAGVKYIVYGKSLKLIQQNMNRENPLTVKITEGEFEYGKNALIDSIPEPKTGKHTITLNDRFYYIVIDTLKPARLKELKEIRGIVISDYQKFLENKWIEELRQKYPVEIYEDRVKSLIKPSSE